MIYIIKQEGLYQNKVNSSLVFTCNCKMGYWVNLPSWNEIYRESKRTLIKIDWLTYRSLQGSIAMLIRWENFIMHDINLTRTTTWNLPGPSGTRDCIDIVSLRSCPLPIIPLCLSREEGMIHFFVGSHVKMPESGLFSDWIGNNADDLRCSDWPKCRHPLVVVDFSLHFYLRNEQWIHTRVRYEISAGSVFLNLKNA